ncbi:helix-turn-helix domain-containing protein [Bacillus cereus group sp. TH43LC]|uniref:helix-turn-helix domain-containing protein n=1 Tax=Bacillus TaxID=1386 RepID=UPI0021131AF9|nr:MULTISPECIES: helix-turn-helix domain-containing protein [Bacillus cereus group]MCQ6521427.1 helix-turn-helix domain-containing protein [Bacillus paranthracis]MCU5227882.1 helix-turn-helix domain-containing protein [Bacillus paranthracis]MDA1501811.1 helix-turn-helix domain-containing protein [Bacillus cereus group sp. TH43LC]MDA1788354.1 helix-turn-helix domain-containing protein [Bacillus cereus group sp. BY5-1LC]MDA1865250.1 helix-turn-helix domain-containing protein [Bacillus cereus gro
MEFYDLGITIKELRMKKNISQSELCHGICSQSQISKIEKGIIYPSSVLLYQLSERLGIDPNHIFALTQNKKLKYVENVKCVMRDCTKQKQYNELYEIVKQEKTENNFQLKEDKQFLIWHEAIAIFYVNKSIKTALNLLNNALKLTVTNGDFLSEREIDIMQSMAIFHWANKEYEKSITILRRCLTNFNKLDFPRDKEVKLKIIFNLGKMLGHANQHEEAIKYNDMGIKLAINLNTLYLLGELYYGKAWNMLQLKQCNEEDVADNMKKALFIFELTEKEDLIKIVKEKYFEQQNKKITHNF